MAYTVPWSETVMDALVEGLQAISEVSGDSFTVDPARVRRYDKRDGERERRPPSIELCLESEDVGEGNIGRYAWSMTVRAEVCIYQHPDSALGSEVLVYRAANDVLRKIATTLDAQDEELNAVLKSASWQPLDLEDNTETMDGAALSLTIATSMDDDTRAPVAPDPEE